MESEHYEADFRVLALKALKKNPLKQKKKFEKLVKNIDDKKKSLAEIAQKRLFINKHLAQELYPLQNAYFDAKFDLLKLFDFYFNNYTFKNAEKKSMINLMNDFVMQLYAAQHEKIDEAILIYDQINKKSFQETLENEKAQKERIASKNNPDKSKMAEIEDFSAGNNFEQAEYSFEKKTKASNIQDTKPAQEMMSNQSIRKVYIDLVKNFHPDKETNETEKVRKNDLMQQITTAYEKEDLLALLAIQLQANLEKETDEMRFSDEKLKQYIKLLEQQDEKLAEDLAQIKREIPPFVEELLPFEDKNIRTKIQQRAKEMKKMLKELREEKIKLTNPAYFKLTLASLLS
jgi:curved DNA-binding protein CbpA